MSDSDKDKIKAMKIASAKKILQAYQLKEKRKERNGEHTEQLIKVTPEKEKTDITFKAAEDMNFPMQSTPTECEFNSNVAKGPGKVDRTSAVLQNGENRNFGASTNSIEFLINEKASLSASLVKFQSECKERNFEVEELSGRLKESQKRVIELEKNVVELQTKISKVSDEKNNFEVELKNKDDEVKICKTRLEEKMENIQELKLELNSEILKREKLEREMKEKDCELKLSQIRVNEISDENSVIVDDRIENLTQAKFVHEQQIHDLQAMVQQLEAEREQSNQQYQNYVQHLNKKIKMLTEKSEELTEENSKLKYRESSLVNHIGELEKQLQQIIKQGNSESFKQETAETNNSEHIDIEGNKQALENITTERDFLQKGIDVAREKILSLEEANKEKDDKLLELESAINNLIAQRPNDSKLLARIENDKVTASIAVAQNEELKNQLNEIQLKLIEITNDKVELVNILHSEQHANREIRANFSQLEDKLKQITEKLHFKDEEMIRLSRENNELSKEIMEQKNIIKQQQNDVVNLKAVEDVSVNVENAETIILPSETNLDGDAHYNDDHSKYEKDSGMEIPTPEAMKKLEERFKSLMADVANLTDEKQRLEHLVMQLQGETETIGEYITLYQTQRRLLKQREIEKDIQLSNLLSQREEMQKSLIIINQLVRDLFQSVNENNVPFSTTFTNSPVLESVINSTENENSEPIEIGANINSQKIAEIKQQEIISKINSLVADLKDNNSLKVATALDHCSCCSGKFETI